MNFLSGQPIAVIAFFFLKKRGGREEDEEEPGSSPLSFLFPEPGLNALHI